MIKLLAGLLLLSSLIYAQPRPSCFNSIRADTDKVAQFGRIELTIDLKPVYINPYDYDDISIHCVFVGPGQRDTVDAFYMQDFTLDTLHGGLRPRQGGSFKVRYTPRIPGRWYYFLYSTGRAGSCAGGAGKFRVIPAVSKGFVRRNKTRWLSFDDGSAYVPIGENMGWATKNAYADYHRWVGRLAAAKGNFIRVWMPSWGLGIEWQKGRNGYAGLEQYRQDNAWYLDWLIDYCGQRGVYLMLTLDHHGQVSSKVDPNWNENPYNAANGGPCEHTWDFFTDARARQLIKNRFRYIVARYGYSANIFCWELFNEVDWTDDYAHHKEEVAAWHAEMAEWLRSKDPNKHLITTSYGSAAHDPATWDLPSIDLTQTHYYISSPHLEHIIDSAGKAYAVRYGKPTLNGEFGLSGDGSKLAVLDPGGIYIHNALWAGLMGGGSGAAVPWYWDNYFDPQDLYRHFTALADLAKGIHFVKDNYAPVPVLAGDAGLRAYVLKSADSSRLAGWVLNNNYNWEYLKDHGQPAPLTGAVLTLAGMKNGMYSVTWSDCRSGARVSADSVIVADHRMQLQCPSVAWDLSVVVTPCTP